MICALACLWLYQSSPTPPKVALEFAGFARQGSEAVAVIALTNSGSETVVVFPASSEGMTWWGGGVQTSTGLVSWIPADNRKIVLRRGGRHEWLMPAPPDATRWGLDVFYDYTASRNVLSVAKDWAERSGALDKLPPAFSSRVAWLLGHAPDMRASALLRLSVQTNVPPVATLIAK